MISFIRPKFELYHNAEYRTFMQNQRSILNTELAAALNLNQRYSEWSAKVDEYLAVFNPQQGSTYTPEIKAQDDRRDAAIRGIKGLLTTISEHHYTLNLKNAATILLDNLNGYGDRIDHQRYQQETGSIAGLVQDWEGELNEHLTNIPLLAEWTTELKAANEQFNDLYLERIDEQAQNNEAAAGSLRPAIDQAYFALTNALYSRGVVAEEDGNTELAQQYSETIVHLNTNTEVSNLAAEGRGGNNNNNNDAEEPTNTENDENS